MEWSNAKHMRQAPDDADGAEAVVDGANGGGGVVTANTGEGAVLAWRDLSIARLSLRWARLGRVSRDDSEGVADADVLHPFNEPLLKLLPDALLDQEAG